MMDRRFPRRRRDESPIATQGGIFMTKSPHFIADMLREMPPDWKRARHTVTCLHRYTADACARASADGRTPQKERSRNLTGSPRRGKISNSHVRYPGTW